MVKRAAPAKTGKNHPGYFRGDRADKQIRSDGWNNLMNGVGITGIDPRKSWGFAPPRILDPETLRYMYRGDGLIRRVVDLPAMEMTRCGYDVHGDPDGLILSRFQEIGVTKALRDLVRWSRLFGGALGVMGVDDGLDFEKPLNEGRIRNLQFIHVFHRWRVVWNWNDLYTDPTNPKFGQPQWYTVTPVWGTMFRIHESRCLRVEGMPVDDLSHFENHSWGDSVVQACFNEFRDLGAAYSATGRILDDFVQAVLSMKGLSSMIESGQDALVKKRLQILDQARHTLHTLLLDSDGEQYQKHASSVAGLSDILDRFAQKASAVTGIPITLLMGEAPSGLQATGDSQRSDWQEKVRADQEEILQPVVERLVHLQFLARDFEFGKEPDEWEIKFRPLDQPTPKALADLQNVRATTAASYITNGVLDPNEVRHSAAVEEFLGEAVEGDLDTEVEGEGTNPANPDKKQLAQGRGEVEPGSGQGGPPAAPTATSDSVIKPSKRKKRGG